MRLREIAIQVDTHTHSVLSGHAFSTVTENCRAAADRGIKGLCMTEHGPAMPGSMPWFAACSYGMLPQQVHGVRLLPGVEFNIIDFDGGLDIDSPSALRKVRFGIASMHDITMPRGSREDHTRAYMAALNHPCVDILGHPGYGHFEHDPEPIVREAKRLGKLIEINNNSFQARAGSRENCMAFARLCKQLDVQICVSSDAHFHDMIGKVDMAMDMLEEAAFPPELILNADAERFFAFIEEREAQKAAHPLFVDNPPGSGGPALQAR